MSNEPNDCDYILVNKLNETEHNHEREIFEKNLQKIGLDLEQIEETKRERFVKICAPKEILLKYCEMMKLRMPLKHHDNLSEQYSRTKIYLFDTESENFITPSTKYMIINYILEQTKFVEDNDNDDGLIDEDCKNFGITKLIMKNAYSGAYPLHDETKREELSKKWTRRFLFFPIPPLEEFKNYFGVKIALYFAWLNFYNRMLCIASAISIFYMIISYLLSFSNRIQDEICNGNETFHMCPQCDKHCHIWNLNKICSYTGLLSILNNNMTIAYAIIMSLWSAFFLNMWSQYSAKLTHKWKVLDSDDLLTNETPTKEYLRNKLNTYNLKKYSSIFWSWSVVLFWLCIVLAVLIGLTFYRISLYTSDWFYGKYKEIYKSTLVEVTGALLDLVSILVLNEVYSKVAIKLTKLELHRTQKEYEESLMWKFYIFWFVNYYSSFFYIAFFKGRFAGTPNKYNRILGYRQEECGPRGCIVDLFIQMAVVMIGDMTYNNIIEYVVPYIKKKMRAGQVAKDKDCEQNLLCNQWIRDYKLLYWGSTEISMEYLEMVLQYGLVILFVTAFPLGPICALLNNIFEIKMDANKLIKNYRRPIAENVKNIGIWLPILQNIISLSIVSNACIIAFTTNFIPDLVYRHYKRKQQSYVDFNLSIMRTSDLDPLSVGNYSVFENITECRYRGYYNPPGHPNEYHISELYWQVLAARLIFVIVFQHVVNLARIIFECIVPPMPTKIRANIINQQKRTQRLIFMEESKLLTDYHV